MRTILLAGCLVLASSAAVSAACPSVIAGTTAAAIEANQLRLICLQNEVAAASRQRQYEQQLQSLETTIQHDELRQRFEALPQIYVPPTQPTMPVYPPGG